jgi:SAM-dependent methyltransferase
MFLKERLRG